MVCPLTAFLTTAVIYKGMQPRKKVKSEKKNRKTGIKEE
jgi:hypothetical protein